MTIPDADILFIFEQDELGFSVGWCGTPDPFWLRGGVLAARLVELLEKFRVWILPIKIIEHHTHELNQHAFVKIKASHKWCSYQF